MEQAKENKCKTRYCVGEKVLGISFTFKDEEFRGFFKLPFFYDTTPVEKIHIVELEVKEHHKVQSEYDNDDVEPKYDGFILTDREGNVWHNQYPYAAYGQLSDTGNRRFRREITSEGEYDELHKQNTVFECHLLTDFVYSLDEGIERYKKALGECDTRWKKEDLGAWKYLKNVKLPMMEKLFNDIVEQLSNEFRKELKKVSILPDLPEITQYVLVDK